MIARFDARQAIERLRCGLFDPTASQHLSAGQDRLLAAARSGFDGTRSHLCICGAYGQGKSHSLHALHRAALANNFAVSLISLDPRELPFHRPRLVYRALMDALRLPGGGDAQTLIAQWKAHAAASDAAPESLLPAQMPRLFSSVLGALARPMVPLDAVQRRQKQHRHYHPAVLTRTLHRALVGERLPIPQIRRALRYRRVPGYQTGSMALRGPEPLVAQIQAMAALMQRMGLAGWVVLLDEGESIAQVRSTLRASSWALLRKWLEPAPGLLSVFAFTEDFLWTMDEDSTGLRSSSMNIHRLGTLSAADWRMLCPRLAALHGRAYGWSVPASQLLPAMQDRLAALKGEEIRLQLKALIYELDVASIEAGVG